MISRTASSKMMKHCLRKSSVLRFQPPPLSKKTHASNTVAKRNESDDWNRLRSLRNARSAASISSCGGGLRNSARPWRAGCSKSSRSLRTGLFLDGNCYVGHSTKVCIDVHVRVFFVRKLHMCLRMWLQTCTYACICWLTRVREKFKVRAKQSVYTQPNAQHIQHTCLSNTPACEHKCLCSKHP